jgi:hypothetical protein
LGRSRSRSDLPLPLHGQVISPSSRLWSMARVLRIQIRVLVHWVPLVMACGSIWRWMLIGRARTAWWRSFLDSCGQFCHITPGDLIEVLLNSSAGSKRGSLIMNSRSQTASRRGGVPCFTTVLVRLGFRIGSPRRFLHSWRSCAVRWLLLEGAVGGWEVSLGSPIKLLNALLRLLLLCAV